jgi:hypothetical protein
MKVLTTEDIVAPGRSEGVCHSVDGVLKTSWLTLRTEAGT